MHLHEMERLLARRGWRLDRIRGSHRHYRNARGQTVTIAAHGRRTFAAWEVKMILDDLARHETAQARRSVLTSEPH